MGSPVAAPETTSPSGHAVLGLHVREDADVESEEPAVTERVMRARLQDTLGGDHGPDVDVDAHEAAAYGSRDGQRGQRIAPEHVDADGQGHRPLDLADHDGHAGDRRGIHPPRGKGHVTVVLHEERVGAAVGEGARVRERGLDDCLHAAGPAGTPRQGAKMHHADDSLVHAHDGGECHLAE